MSRIVEDINEIVNQLRIGNVVALPTETVYGLAADATNDDAVCKVFDVKQRPKNHPLIMHVSSDWDLTTWVETIPKYTEALIKKFWPGPLTFVFKLKKDANISKLVTGSQDTIAIRCPSHPMALEILNKLGRPFVAPSANPFGRISPTNAAHVLHDFPTDTFFILDGGTCNVGIESTIISCLKNDSCSILRPGVIGEIELQEFCKVIKSESKIRVSGNLKYHYQPQKPLFYFTNNDIELVKNIFLKDNNIYLLTFSSIFDNNLTNYTFPSSVKSAARELYRQLRIADNSNTDLILIELPPNHQEWNGLVERIKKAGKNIRTNE